MRCLVGWLVSLKAKVSKVWAKCNGVSLKAKVSKASKWATKVSKGYDFWPFRARIMMRGAQTAARRLGNRQYLVGWLVGWLVKSLLSYAGGDPIKMAPQPRNITWEQGPRLNHIVGFMLTSH